jgi:hypothetical protein
MAVLHWQNTYGAGWEIAGFLSPLLKRDANVGKNFKK